MPDSGGFRDAAGLVEVQWKLSADVPNTVTEIVDQESAALDIGQQVMDAAGDRPRDGTSHTVSQGL